jgi:hypothetical protein
MKPYQELYPKGTKIRIASAQELRDFRKSWKLHNPLTDEQLAFAGHHATIKSVGYYHGGDVLCSATIRMIKRVNQDGKFLAGRISELSHRI